VAVTSTISCITVEMNIVHNIAGNGIPLHCNICPKKPDFSDTSHLLTHIASKQHLSNYYKLKVSISVNPVARRDVDDYDRWYQQWNLDELMRDRMSQKEKRGRGGGGRRAPAGQLSLHTYIGQDND